jgi:hypothetical protein
MIPFDALRKLAMHANSDVHERAVTVSCVEKPAVIGGDHVVPPSSVVSTLVPLFDASRITHDSGA